MKQTLILASFILLLVACQKKEQGINSNQPKFDLDKFEQNIKTTYGPQAVGYSYTIAIGDKIMRFGAAGKATRSDGDVPYTIETRQEIFSVTKFMTAIAVFKMLQIKGISPDAYIHNYLPNSWTIHPSLMQISFRRLLSHNSGFAKNDRDYASLKQMMNIAQIDTTRTYNNANFALCRILLPYMKYGKGYFAAAEMNNTLESATALEFREIMRDLVLQPSNIAHWEKIDFKNWNHQGLNNYNYTMFYRWNSNLAPVTNSDDVLIAGSRGLVMSTYEIAQVMIAFENNQLVPEQTKQLMKIAGCGFDGVNGIGGAKGRYFWKNGGGPGGPGPGGECIIMSFPNSIYVSINSNSNVSDDIQHVASPSKLAKAYDDAW
ncbi:serine hydrolase domain-containing protein [Lacibacter sp. H407]|uniref:serine hydrolase domain-containing protein n=1 Tax=Lacibacter sp. H407 TaxID=3133423 RepID=UPI0030BC87EE